MNVSAVVCMSYIFSMGMKPNQSGNHLMFPSVLQCVGTTGQGRLAALGRSMAALYIVTTVEFLCMYVCTLGCIM